MTVHCCLHKGAFIIPLTNYYPLETSQKHVLAEGIQHLTISFFFLYQSGNRSKFPKWRFIFFGFLGGLYFTETETLKTPSGEQAVLFIYSICFLFLNFFKPFSCITQYPSFHIDTHEEGLNIAG